MSEATLLPPQEESSSPAIDPIQFFEEHPLICLGIAAGVGYIAGGGLFTPLTTRVVKAGARAVILPTLKARLKSFTQE